MREINRTEETKSGAVCPSSRRDNKNPWALYDKETGIPEAFSVSASFVCLRYKSAPYLLPGQASQKILITKYDIMGASPVKYNTMFMHWINQWSLKRSSVWRRKIGQHVWIFSGQMARKHGFLIHRLDIDVLEEDSRLRLDHFFNLVKALFSIRVLNSALCF